MEIEANIVRNVLRAYTMMLFLIELRVAIAKRLLALHHIEAARRLLEGE
jgi:hypothetical protein